MPNTIAMTVTAVPQSSGIPWMRRYSVAFLANQEPNTALMAAAELVAHVLRERGSRASRDLVLVGLHELPQLAGRDIGVGRRAEARLHGVERSSKTSRLMSSTTTENIVMNRR